MASVNDILQISNYKGQGYAGGNVAPAIDINPSQINQVLQLTVRQNEDLWKRGLVLKDEAANQITNFNSLDLSSLSPELSKEFISLRDNLNKAFEDPQVFNRDTPEGLKKWSQNQKDIGKFQNMVGIEKKNQLYSNQYKKQIAQEPDLQKRRDMQELFDLTNKNYYDKGKENIEKGILLNYESAVAPLSFDAYKENLITFDDFIKLPNDNKKTTYKVVDKNSYLTQAAKIGAGMMPPFKYNDNETPTQNRTRELLEKMQNDNPVLKTIQFMKSGLASNDPTIVANTIDDIKLYNADAIKYNDLEGVKNGKVVGQFPEISLKEIKDPTTGNVLGYSLTPMELGALALHKRGDGSFIKEIKIDVDNTGEANKLAVEKEQTRRAIGVASVTAQAGIKEKQIEADAKKYGDWAQYVFQKPSDAKGGTLYGTMAAIQSENMSGGNQKFLAKDSYFGADKFSQAMRSNPNYKKASHITVHNSGVSFWEYRAATKQEAEAKGIKEGDMFYAPITHLDRKTINQMGSSYITQFQGATERKDQVVYDYGDPEIDTNKTTTSNTSSKGGKTYKGLDADGNPIFE